MQEPFLEPLRRFMHAAKFRRPKLSLKNDCLLSCMTRGRIGTLNQHSQLNLNSHHLIEPHWMCHISIQRSLSSPILWFGYESLSTIRSLHLHLIWSTCRFRPSMAAAYHSWDTIKISFRPGYSVLRSSPHYVLQQFPSPQSANHPS